MGKFVVIAIFICFELVSAAPSSSASETIVQDWLTLNTTVQVDQPSSGYIGEYGVIQHVWSKRYILPDGGLWPGENANLRIGATASSDENLFRFVQVKGHWGYIEHRCGKVVHPYGGKDNPGDNTRLVLHGERHSATYFKFEEEDEQIIHRGEKIFHPKGGNVDPGMGTQMVLHKGFHDGARFQFVPSAYPEPELTGRWEMLFAVIDPINEHTYTIKFKIGKSMTKQQTEKYYWKVSGAIAKSWFQADGRYDKYACLSQTETWEVEVESIYSLKVLPGPTVVTWQWVFEAERLDEAYRFRSTILGDTNDLDTPPEIDPAAFPNSC